MNWTVLTSVVTSDNVSTGPNMNYKVMARLELRNKDGAVIQVMEAPAGEGEVFPYEVRDGLDRLVGAHLAALADKLKYGEFAITEGCDNEKGKEGQTAEAC